MGLERVVFMKFFPSVGLRAGLAALLACATVSGASAASGRLTIDSGGLKRTAFVVEHARLKRALRPTIIVLHGQSGAGLRIRRYLGLEEVLKSPSVVAVYPDAVDGHWDVSDKGDRDIRFIQDLVSKLEADGISDRRRIFVVGTATGGILAMRLACANTQMLAGAASLISLMPAADAAACNPAKPLPFMLMAGTADPMVPYNGGKADLVEYKGDVVSADATIAPFAKAAGCTGKPVKIDVADRDPNDGSRVQIETQQGCKAPVELVRIEGGGHTLPGRRRIGERGLAVGAHNNDIDAARVLLDFVKQAVDR